MQVTKPLSAAAGEPMLAEVNMPKLGTTGVSLAREQLQLGCRLGQQLVEGKQSPPHADKLNSRVLSFSTSSSTEEHIARSAKRGTTMHRCNAKRKLTDAEGRGGSGSCCTRSLPHRMRWPQNPLTTVA